MSTYDVIVVGAGLAGLGAARVLVDAGLSVLVIDKGRGVGGRCATRRLAIEGKELRLDHGAPCFTLRDPAFREALLPLLEAGLVRPWVDGLVTAVDGRFVPPPAEYVEPRYAHRDGNAAIARHLALGLDVVLETAVTGIHREGDRWRVTAHGLEATWQSPEASPESAGSWVREATRVIVTCPVPQVRTLVSSERSIPEVAYEVVWAVMAVYQPGASPSQVPSDALRFEQEPVLDRAYRDSSKRDVSPYETWVFHTRADWSDRHVETDRTAIARHVLAAASRALGADFETAPLVVQVHRWRYARPVQVLPEPDPVEAGLLLAGDAWGERIEGAWLSGVRSAWRLLEREA